MPATDTPSSSFTLTHHIPSGGSGSSGNQSSCYAASTAQSSMTDCTKQTAQMQVRLTGWMQVWQEHQTGIGGILCNIATLSCTTLSLQTTVKTARTIPVSLTGTVDLPFCFTNLAVCALDQGNGEAKGQEESFDTGFGKGGLAGDLGAVVAAKNAGDDAATGGKCSFTPDTAVSTDHGEQAISTLQVGERVLAYNPKTGKMEQEPILHVWINHDSDLVDLTVTTTTKGEHGKPAPRTSEVVHTNQKHPFFTMERGFLPVGQVKLGMHILRADGRVGVVTGWKVVSGTRAMYNLEVAHDHTFTVGAGQWVVHNSNEPCGVDPAQALAKARQDLGMPPKGSPGKKYVVAILTADGQEFWGMNGKKPISFNVNAISASHAEIDALDQLARNRATSTISGGIGEMWVDTVPCPPCDKFGGIRSGVRAAGLDSLNIWFPGGNLTITR